MDQTPRIFACSPMPVGRLPAIAAFAILATRTSLLSHVLVLGSVNANTHEREVRVLNTFRKPGFGHFRP